MTDNGLLVVPTLRLLNVSDEGDKVTAVTPVPVRLTVCGLFVALSVMVTVPVAVPVVEGVKVTEIEHFFPAGTELPHVLVSAKFPPIVMLVIVSVELPVLVNKTFFAALVVPTTTVPKFRLVAESVTVWALAIGLTESTVNKSETYPLDRVRRNALFTSSIREDSRPESPTRPKINGTITEDLRLHK